jgi:hypothetical protein
MTADHTDIVDRLQERVPRVKFVNVTKLLEKDTSHVIHALQTRAVTYGEFDEGSQLTKLIGVLHCDDHFAFVVHNSELIRHHPSWFDCVDKRRGFELGVPWCLLYRDDYFMPNPTMDVSRALNTAIDTLFNNDVCCICLEKIVDKESTLLVPCNHIVHTHCMRQWGGTCPVCRSS